MEGFVHEEMDRVIKRSLNIKNLYLDPNNYRFADEVDYVKISDSEITSDRVQKRTRKYIEGEKRSNIQDLLKSFRSNGFLKVDVIQLRDLGNNNYLVIEGNRRVTALKCLQDDYKNGKEIGKLDLSIFSKVPAEIYDGQTAPKEHLIIMGLKHISGNKKWAAINQAQLIFDYLKEFWGNNVIYIEKEIELCESLGITKNKLRASQRAIHIINEYKLSDFGDQFKSDMYSIFEETVKKTQIKTWLNWDESNYQSGNKMNEERFFSWISTMELISDSGGDEIIEREAIITKATEIRYLAEFINSSDAIEIMEKSGSVVAAYKKSGIDERATIDNSIKEIRDNIKAIKRYEDLLNDDDYKQLEKTEKEFDYLMPQKNAINIINKSVTSYWNSGVNQHFTTVNIKTFKKFANVTLPNLNRVNIFAGKNNSGKTTILEALYLLCCQNNLSGYFELNQIRKKSELISYNYLSDVLQDPINICGDFNNYPVEVTIDKYNDPTIDKGDSYLASLRSLGKIEETVNNMVLHTYAKGSNISNYNVIQHLCKVYYSSPYFARKHQLVDLYNAAVETKYEGRTVKEYVLDFVRTIDETINDISSINDNDEVRFVVDSSRFPEDIVDLSIYGDGLIRIFEMALSFSYCRNGVLLIDELETAIHYSMLVKFTEFIQKMSEMFNVQVFLTTHSKECVDAFLENGYKNEQISAYIVRTRGQENEAKYISGEKLEKLIDLISFDLRGGDGDEA